jgi:lycopene beta-cyclase
VVVDGQSFSGSWVFDSTLPPSLRGSVPTSLRASFAKQSPAATDEIASSSSGLLAMTTDGHYHHLNQHFRGWEIETDRPVFNPQLPTLFDFRTPQAGHMCFVYTLPLAENRALIEYTLFSSHLLTLEEYDAGLKTYIEDVLNIKQYTINHVEAGVIPMTDHPFPRRLGQRVMSIGTKGGRVKPSTGYAFLRIQRDSAAIVQSLIAHGQPFAIPGRRGRFGLHDSILLNIMTRHPDDLKPIFTIMFKHNPIQRIFRFLDETATLSEEVRFIASLPPWRFLQALFRLKVLQRV